MRRIGFNLKAGLAFCSLFAVSALLFQNCGSPLSVDPSLKTALSSSGTSLGQPTGNDNGNSNGNGNDNGNSNGNGNDNGNSNGNGNGNGSDSSSGGGSNSTPPTGNNLPPVQGENQYPFGSRRFAYKGSPIRPQVAQATMDAQVKKLYDHWKSSYIRQGCGGWYVAGGQPNTLGVSEGQGYGMLITVLMAGYDPQARTIFDGIHKFARARGSTLSPYLMSWLINNDCSVAEPWPAADGDLDMAMALLMADKQWGSNTGSINYLQEAKTTINAIRQKLTQSYLLIGSGPVDLVRTSDMMIGHFRAFQKATGDNSWNTIIDNSFNILNKVMAQYAPNTGLQPDFIQNADTNSPRPSVGGRLESNLEGYYSYNACRNPWRFATDYVVSGDARSKAIAQKTIDFFKQSSGGDPSRIYAVYTMDGQALQQYNNLAFQAPIMLGAIVDSSNQPFLDSMWNYVAPKTATYYDESIQLLSMIVASGNWWQP